MTVIAARIAIAIGIPGSGKSSLARRWQQRFPSTPIVSTDRIRGQLFGDESVQGAWEAVWEQVLVQLAAGRDRLYRNEAPLAFYDATNAIRAHRRDAIAAARQLGFTEMVGVFLDLPLPVCQKRNQKRDRTVPHSVLANMHRQLRAYPPHLDEGWQYLLHCPSVTSAEIALAAVCKNRTRVPPSL